MNVLLDTHVFLWWIDDSPKLSSRARKIIGDANNGVFLSAASGWEMAIKVHLGKLTLPHPLERFVVEQLTINAFQVLPIQLSHTLHTYTLPDIHRDPFDRILVAQSQVEGIPILTADRQIARYPVQVIW